MTALGLIVLLALQGQDSNPLPKQPIRDYTITRKDPRHNPKTGKDVDEITLILQGNEAIPIRGEKHKEIVDLRGVKATYFSEPDKDKLSKEIQVTARRGHLDNEARVLKLEDHVRVVRKNDDDTPPRADTVLEASSLVLHFNRVYECPQCRKLQIRKFHPKPGRCPEHDVPLKEATVTSVETDGDFEINGPEGILSGIGLVTDDAINRDYHIAKNGFVEFGSVPKADQKAEIPVAPKFSQIYSRGPLWVGGAERERTIKGQDGMRIDRIDSSGTLTIVAQEMTIETFAPPDGNAGSPELANVDAAGKVILEGVVFADGTSLHTTSDTLARRLDRERRMETTDLKSTGENLVHLKAGSSTIESRSVRITRHEDEVGGVSEFEDVERSDLTAGPQHFTLKCAKLTTIAEPDKAGRPNLRTLIARQNVTLGGLAAGPQGEPGQAQADYFEWDTVAQRGRLEATPLVRITQGASLITAPKVVLESPNIIVLKGPKNVHLVQEREGAKEDYAATCEGDLVLDQVTHRLEMRNKCVIRTKDLLLRSDRVNAKLTEGGGANQGLESLLAVGGVSALRRQDNTTLYGDRLAFRFADQDLKVYGAPYAVADGGRVTSRQEQIRVYEDLSPRTKQKVRFTQLLGGADGVRIEMEEKAGPEHPHPAGKPK